jgi:hypothetical protein
MAQINDILKSDLTKGLALGIGVAMLLPVAITTFAPVLRPAARGAIKSGMLAYERGREMLSEFGETIEDLVAETQAELQAERMAAETEVDPEVDAGDDPAAAASDADSDKAA